MRCLALLGALAVSVSAAAGMEEKVLYVRYAPDGRSARLCRSSAVSPEKDLADGTGIQAMRLTPRGSVLAIIRKRMSPPRIVEIDPDGRPVGEWNVTGALSAGDMDLYAAEMLDTGNVLLLGTIVSPADQHDRTLFIAELDRDGKVVRRLDGFPEGERVFAMRPSGPDGLLIGSKAKGAVEIGWDGREKAAFKVPPAAACRDLLRLPDGNLAVASGGQVSVWTPAGEVVWSVRVHEAKSLQLLPDGHLLVGVAGGGARTCAVELDARGKVVREYENAMGPIVRMR